MRDADRQGAQAGEGDDGNPDACDPWSHDGTMIAEDRSGTTTRTVVVGPDTVLVMAVVESAAPFAATVEIRDPAGVVVSTSVPTADGAMAMLVPAGSGDYTVTVLGAEGQDYRLTVVQRDAPGT